MGNLSCVVCHTVLRPPRNHPDDRDREYDPDPKILRESRIVIEKDDLRWVHQLDKTFVEN